MPNPSQMTDEEVMARILEDAETGQIAEALGLDPVDYAARVLHYIRNPNAEPQLEILDAVGEKEAGMPSKAECLDYLQKIDSGAIPLDDSEVTHFAGFDEDEKSAAALTGSRRKGPAAPPPMPPVPGEPAPGGPKRRSGR